MSLSVRSAFTASESVVINWTASTNATKYGLSVWRDGNLIFDSYVTGRSKNIGALPTGSYRVAMKPYNASGGGPNSNVVDFKVIAPAPSQPVALPTSTQNGFSILPSIKQVIQQWAPQYGPNPSYDSRVWGKYDSISYDACGVAAASMALSSLGIDKSPIEICDLNVAAGNNDGSSMACWGKLAPKHTVTATIGSTKDIETALANYKSNPAKYSPPIMYLIPRHFVVVTGEIDGYYLTYDPGYPGVKKLKKPANYSEVHQFSK
jgi:hypothetical protein